jgi:predicted O-methyltransferase YrrM
MSQAAVCPAPAVLVQYERCDHAIGRGQFPALVFSGDRNVLGELPGELTASTLFKFAMVDERLDASFDFARTPHMPLPLWPADRAEPVDGVCFVLSDANHPAIERLRMRGAIEHEHFIVAQDSQATSVELRLHKQLSQISHLPRNAVIVLLGYGDQGARISAILRQQLDRHPNTICILDDNEDSRRRAIANGHRIIDNVADAPVVALIYTPLMRYERLYHIYRRHCLASIVIDNSSDLQNVEHFKSRGDIWLEPAADRALHVRGSKLRLKPHGLPLYSAPIVREDMRMLGCAEVRHLSSGHRAVFSSALAEFDCSISGSADRLSSRTFSGMRRAFVSLRDRPDAAVFAARALCSDLWPDATERVFPARCVPDLGATRFERIIKRHIDGAEVITASQTSAQQVVLGIIAHNYAGDTPTVEIGSALGGSGALIAAATDQHRPPFYSIDPETVTRHTMRWAFQQQDQLERLHQVNCTSDDAITQLQNLRQRAGLVFIDGLHTYAATAADFANYAPLVRPGGALVIHDVEPARYSVLRVVLEKVLADKRFAPKCLVDGLLVLERVIGR